MRELQASDCTRWTLDECPRPWGAAASDCVLHCTEFRPKIGRCTARDCRNWRADTLECRPPCAAFRKDPPVPVVISDPLFECVDRCAVFQLRPRKDRQAQTVLATEPALKAAAALAAGDDQSFQQEVMRAQRDAFRRDVEYHDRQRSGGRGNG